MPLRALVDSDGKVSQNEKGGSYRIDGYPNITHGNIERAWDPAKLRQDNHRVNVPCHERPEHRPRNDRSTSKIGGECQQSAKCDGVAAIGRFRR